MFKYTTSIWRQIFESAVLYCSNSAFAKIFISTIQRLRNQVNRKWVVKSTKNNFPVTVPENLMLRGYAVTQLRVCYCMFNYTPNSTGPELFIIIEFECTKKFIFWFRFVVFADDDRIKGLYP